MKKTLELVRGAVSTNDLLPVLTHFHIYNGRVQGGNGRIVIDAPCPELAGFDCTVPAERFLKAVDACDGEPRLKLTDGGKLTASKGKFRATLPLADHAAFPKVEEIPPAASSFLDSVSFPALLPVLERLRPFISTDRTKPWLCSIFFNEGYAWATDNVCLARVPHHTFQNFILPAYAVDELLRINEEPVKIQSDMTSIVFYFRGDWWIKAQKLYGEWPNVSALIPRSPPKERLASTPLAEAIRKILPFCPEKEHALIHTGPEGVSTSAGETSAVVGYDGTPVGCFRAEPFLTVLDASTSIDLSGYPGVCYWQGEGIDGVFVGVRK